MPPLTATTSDSQYSAVSIPLSIRLLLALNYYSPHLSRQFYPRNSLPITSEAVLFSEFFRLKCAATLLSHFYCLLSFAWPLFSAQCKLCGLFVLLLWTEPCFLRSVRHPRSKSTITQRGGRPLPLPLSLPLHLLTLLHAFYQFWPSPL